MSDSNDSIRANILLCKAMADAPVFLDPAMAAKYAASAMLLVTMLTERVEVLGGRLAKLEAQREDDGK